MNGSSAPNQGFTLLELLIAMSVLGVLLLAFTQIFGSSLRASSEINSRSELLSEAQIAQQIIASRLQQASYIYPPGTSLQFASSGHTSRKPAGGYTWTVGTDPIVAMILPPSFNFDGLTAVTCNNTTEQNKRACFNFVAYYPVLRSHYVANAASSQNPGVDTANGDTWMLMEYRGFFYDNVTRTNPRQNPPNPSNYPTGSGFQGRLLVDYVQPQATAPSYTMFAVDAASRRVTFNLRMLRRQGGRALTVPASNAGALNMQVYPRNW